MRNNLLDGYMVARVSFVDRYNNKIYSYALYDEANVEDLVLCDNNNVAQIIEIMTLDECEQGRYTKPTAQIKCVIDETAYKNRVEKANRKSELKKKMDDRISQLQKEQIYTLFAEKDSALAELLNEYKGI